MCVNICRILSTNQVFNETMFMYLILVHMKHQLHEVSAIVVKNMSAPGFCDLGKNVREVLNNGYNYGKRLLNFTMKNTGEDLEIGNSYSVEHSDSTMHGESTAKFKLRDYGILSEKWSTDGKLQFRFKHHKLYDGLDIIADLIHKPASNQSSLKCGLNYSNEYVNIGGNVCKDSNNLDFKYLKLSAKAVVALKDALFGYRVGYDSASHALTKSEIGLSYKFPKIGIHFNCSPGFSDDFGISTVVKVTDTFDAALSAGCVSNNLELTPNMNRGYGMFNEIAAEWVGSIGGRYQVNDDTIVRAKIDSNLQLSTSLKLPIVEGVNVTTALGIDLDDPLKGDHRVGITIDVNA